MQSEDRNLTLTKCDLAISLLYFEPTRVDWYKSQMKMFGLALVSMLCDHNAAAQHWRNNSVVGISFVFINLGRYLLLNLRGILTDRENFEQKLNIFPLYKMEKCCNFIFLTVNS